jgi:hypothetical protein
MTESAALLVQEVFYRIAVGPQQGRKVFTLQRLPGCRSTPGSRHKQTKLAALVPKSRVNLTGFHGVFAPNSRYRARVTPARRSKRQRTLHAGAGVGEERAPASEQVLYTVYTQSMGALS